MTASSLPKSSKVKPKKPVDQLTNVQRRMLAVLSDGEAHTKAELHACLWDDKSQLSAIGFHLTALRKFLKTYGHTVVCELAHRRSIRYRWVRLVSEAATNAICFGS